MNCQQARSQIALWVGGDLDAPAWESVQQHLRQCSTCQSYQTRMQGMLELLGSSDDSQDLSAENELSHDSLWPALSSKLPKPKQKPRSNEFKGWIPALALAAVCVVMVFAGSRPPQNGSESGWTYGRGAAESSSIQPVPAWFRAEEETRLNNRLSPANSSQPDSELPNAWPEPRMIFFHE